MQRNDNGKVVWLTFENLSSFPELIHGTFLRHGGVSSGPFSSLNFKMDGGENEACVQKNQALAQEALHLPKLVFMNQLHEKTIVEVSQETLKQENPSCDGLITTQKEIGLAVRHADCQAALFYDPIHKAIGAAHAGWKGQAINIYQAIVEQMKARYQSRPENLFVGVSPSLGPEAAEFKNYERELPPSFWSFQVKPLYFDLWEIARSQLLSLGILPHHIEIARLSTFSHPEDFFSYRREKITGRHATVIALKK